MIKKLWSIAKADAGEVLAVIVCLALVFWIVSCEAHVESITKPGMSVTRSGLQAELDLYMSLARVRFAQLDRQEAFQQFIFENALLFAESGTINPQGVIMMLFSILGIGAVTDNVRKRITIKNNNKSK